VQSAKWAAPTFVILKKNGTVRVITDFHMLNACLKCKPFPMPKIPEIQCPSHGYQTCNRHFPKTDVGAIP
jgi:hypothetical protein